MEDEGDHARDDDRENLGDNNEGVDLLDVNDEDGDDICWAVKNGVLFSDNGRDDTLDNEGDGSLGDDKYFLESAK